MGSDLRKDLAERALPRIVPPRKDNMNLVWIRVDDVEAEPWQMTLVTSIQQATELSSGNAQQASRGADQNFPAYLREQVPTSKRDGFIVQGRHKSDSLVK
jgi:hypothetical protein